MSHPLERIMSEVDLATMLEAINDFELSLRIHVPDGELFTSGGELNLRNRYASALFHARGLRGVLLNMQETSS